MRFRILCENPFFFYFPQYFSHGIITFILMLTSNNHFPDILDGQQLLEKNVTYERTLLRTLHQI